MGKKSNMLNLLNEVISWSEIMAANEEKFILVDKAILYSVVESRMIDEFADMEVLQRLHERLLACSEFSFRIMMSVSEIKKVFTGHRWIPLQTFKRCKYDRCLKNSND